MAVYTHLSAEELAALIAHYDVGTLVSAKGIAEGISNSNWLVETTGPGGSGARYILTMYERRIDAGDLPFFLGLLDHLAEKQCPVPATIHDREGAAYRMVDGKAVALIEFLPGVSVDHPTPGQARAVGQALASIHLASEDYGGRRANDLRPREWQSIFESCGEEALAAIDPSLLNAVRTHMPAMLSQWPESLPRAIIHADLFPDNVLMLGDSVSGLIDFYFACHDIAAYDLAVTHAAWCFDRSGASFRHDISAALISGYCEGRPLADEERAALPVLAQGAAIRFVATRAQDWIDTPADALVTRKDPREFLRRLEFYKAHGEEVFAA